MCVSNRHFKAPGSPATAHRASAPAHRLDATTNVFVVIAFTGLADLSAVTETLSQIRAWSGAPVWRYPLASDRQRLCRRHMALGGFRMLHDASGFPETFDDLVIPALL